MSIHHYTPRADVQPLQLVTGTSAIVESFFIFILTELNICRCVTLYIILFSIENSLCKIYCM